MTANDGSGLSATTTITVLRRADSVSLSPSEATIPLGSTQGLTATVLPTTTSDQSLTWTSNNEAVATVDENGLVTALQAGEATITAKTNDGSNKSATALVKVIVPVTAITFLESIKTNLYVGDDESLRVQVSPANASNPGYTFSLISGADIVQFNAETGHVYFKKEGKASFKVVSNENPDIFDTIEFTIDTYKVESVAFATA